jgi:PKD repeat protein
MHDEDSSVSRDLDGRVLATSMDAISRSALSVAQLGIIGADRLGDVHPHPSNCTTRRGVRGALAEGFERAQRVGSHGTPARGVPGVSGCERSPDLTKDPTLRVGSAIAVLSGLQNLRKNPLSVSGHGLHVPTELSRRSCRMNHLRMVAQLIFVLVAAVLVMCVTEARRAAAAESPYGEVTRFGGYDLTGNTQGKFVMPVGFVVEPEDTQASQQNDVYVLDRTVSDVATGELDYRLQKLSSSGAPLGSATISEKYADKQEFSDAHPLVGLAVDPSRKRVYAIVESIIESEEKFVPVADELVAWSTEPVGGQLVKADPNETEFKEDSVTKASLIAAQSTFSPSNLATALYAPAGLTVDPSTGDVVIDAQEGADTESGETGQTVLQRVITVGPSKGSFGAKRAVGVAGEDTAGGVFAATDGSGLLGTHLFGGEGELVSKIVTVSGDFANSGETPLTAGDSQNDVDQDVSIDLERRPNPGGNTLPASPRGLEVFTAGSQVTQLNDSQHLYAALYAAPVGGPVGDTQAGVPWELAGKSPNFLWIAGGPSDERWGNVGVRLFEADGTIVDTIGGGRPTAPPAAGASGLLGSCDIDYEAASVAAGANGAVFVLTQPNAKTTSSTPVADEVVEFAPGGSHPCPSMTGNIEVNGAEAKPEGSEPTAKVTAEAGVKTKFDAISLDRALAWAPEVGLEGVLFEWNPKPLEWQPFAFEWNFGDEPTGGSAHDGYTVSNKIESGGAHNYLWPTPEAEHEYKTPGVYEANVRVHSDLGTKVFPVSVKVLASTPPVASFTAPTTLTTGKPVIFDASASKPTAGAEIEDYEWEFGAGTTPVPEGAQPKVEHTFATPGKYVVKLTVHDREGSEPEASVTQEVTVTGEPVPPPPSGGGGGGTTGGGSTSTVTSVPSKVVGPSQSPPAKTKPLSSAQKLAKALKACKKLKTKKQRVSCEKLAKKKYAAKPKKKHTKKK